MTLPTLEQAHRLITDLSEDLQNLKIKKYDSFGHYLRVAQNAQKLAAAIAGMNPEKAYIMGLLHDYGQVDEAKDKRNFHGWAGYQKLMALGYDEAARAALVHSFFEGEKIIPERYDSYDAQCINKCAEILKQRPFDEYDKLVHLADLTALGQNAATIEMRFEYLAVTYHINAELLQDKYSLACQLKAHFDHLCGTDVYDILNIKLPSKAV